MGSLRTSDETYHQASLRFNTSYLAAHSYKSECDFMFLDLEYSLRGILFLDGNACCFGMRCIGINNSARMNQIGRSNRIDYQHEKFSSCIPAASYLSSNDGMTKEDQDKEHIKPQRRTSIV